MRASNDNYLRLDVTNLAVEIDALFAAYPELADDIELRQDMLDGETNINAVLERLLTVEREANSLMAAIKQRQDDLSARRQRAERRKDAMRSLMLKLLKAANLPKVPLTEATISVTKGRDSVEITDEAAVPARFLKVVKTPDKTAIGEALKAGKTVKGAALKTGEPTLSVRAA